VQTQPSILRSETADWLPPVARVGDGAAEAGPDAPRHSATVAFDDAVPGMAVEVRYGLDPVANVWVASFFDGATGEFVKTVPATKVMHQLAELRAHYERLVDRTA
jgi:hypothetical protein